MQRCEFVHVSFFQVFITCQALLKRLLWSEKRWKVQELCRLRYLLKQWLWPLPKLDDEQADTGHELWRSSRLMQRMPTAETDSAGHQLHCAQGPVWRHARDGCKRGSDVRHQGLWERCRNPGGSRSKRGALRQPLEKEQLLRLPHGCSVKLNREFDCCCQLIGFVTRRSMF